MAAFRRVAVYCGSSNDVHERYFDAAREVARVLVGRGIGIVYGGGKVGLMGALADAALAEGGEVIGVIPHRLRALEVGHDGLTELVVVDSMHARKTVMSGLSDAFLGLPGGFGTLDEVFEAVTWTQLGYHRKPVGLLNVAGYFDKLTQFVEGAVDQGFVRPAHGGLLVAKDDPATLLEALQGMALPEVKQWMERP